jgi:hypothetical protein
MGLISKVFKKSSETKYHSNIAISAYEPVDISSYTIKDLVEASPMGIRGTYRLIQRVTNVVFMVSKKQDDICWSIAEALGFKKLKNSSKDIDDVYFVCASVAAMYLYSYHYYAHKLPNNAAVTFSSWLKKMNRDMFTYYQREAMGWEDEKDAGTFIQLLTRSDELGRLIDDESMADNELLMIRVTPDMGPDYKASIMSASEYSMCSSEVVVVFIHPYQYGLVKELYNIDKMDTSGYNPPEDTYDDMIACEILEDEDQQ